MTVINTNTAAINAQYNLSKVQSAMDDAMSALSSGKRITSAADDAAGLSIITRMESQVRGLNQAMRNAADGQSMVDTAEGAMEEITNMLQRMRELALQASNETLNTQDRANLDQEVQNLKAEIDRISGNTTFNNQSLLDGTYTGKELQIGDNSGQTLSVSIGSMSTTALGTSLSVDSSVAATTASAKGTEAVSNVTNLTFNGNDTYGFKIVLDGQTEAVGGAADKEINISAAMAGSDAATIAAAINTAVAGNATDATGTANGADLSGILSATASGNVVTLTAADGKKVDISAFTSAAGGSMTVNQVTNSSAEAVTLEDVTEQKGISNTGGSTATAASAVLQLDEDKKFQFRVDGTLIEVSGATGDGAATATAIKNAIDAVSGQNKATVTFTDQGSHHSYDISDATGREINISGFQKITSAAVPDGYMTIDQDVSSSDPKVIESGEYPSSTPAASGGTVLAIADAKTGNISFSNQDLKYTFQMDVDGDSTAETYIVDGKDKDFMAELTRVATEITNTGGTGVSAVNNGGVLEISNTSGSAVSFQDATVSAPGEAAVTAGNAYFAEGTYAAKDVTATGNGISDEASVTTLVDGSIVSTTNGVEAVASQLSLDIKGDDRYSFVIDKDNDGGSDATITADILSGNLAGLVNSINAHSSTTGIVAATDGGQVLLTKADGTAFAIHSFSAENNGSIVAANALGQGGAKTLENDGDGAAVTIAASGAATETEMKLSFSAVDKYSFKISDGNATATVRATATTDAGTDGINATADVADIKAEIASALNAANMSNVTVTDNADGTLTLKNLLGGKIDITNFKSDATGEMTATPASGQGPGVILDDDALSSSQAAISSIAVTDKANAQMAIDAIDRAFEEINAQRAELGAISNRLDHTISNLGNIVVNTEAAQSRIEDADFASETSNLTKAQILSQAATAMLAQANASKQSVLSLLQG